MRPPAHVLDGSIIALVDAGGARGFESVRGTWRRLGIHASIYWQTAEYAEALAPRLGDDAVWAELGDGERPAAAALLRRSRRRGLRVLGAARIGLGNVPFPLCLLDEQAFGDRPLRDLLERFGSWDVLWLTGLRADSPWLSIGGRGGHARVEPHGGVGVLDVATAGELPRNMRDAVRKARRRIEAAGGGELTVASGAAIGAAFERHVALEASGWKGRKGTALAARAFERELLGAYAQSAPGAQVRMLSIGGEPAASQLCFTTAGTLALRAIAYDERFADCSPSNVLMADLVEHCRAQAAIERIDCLVWHDWHARWGMTRVPTHTLAAFNAAGARGRAAGLAYRGRLALAARVGWGRG